MGNNNAKRNQNIKFRLNVMQNRSPPYAKTLIYRTANLWSSTKSTRHGKIPQRSWVTPMSTPYKYKLELC